nr:transcription factor [Pseudogymnoascus verrucosus]
MAPTAVLYLCKVIESIAWETDKHRNAIAEFKQRSLVAAQEVLGLTRSISHLSYFKVHPFTPLPLGFCVEFLNAHHYLGEFVDKQVQEILQALNELSTVNNLAQDYLSSLPIKITGTSYF